MDHNRFLINVNELRFCSNVGEKRRFYKCKLTCPYNPYASVHNNQRSRTSLSALIINITVSPYDVPETYPPPKTYTVTWFLYPDHYKGPFITALFRSSFLFLLFPLLIL
jgi:hypothetical protein